MPSERAIVETLNRRELLDLVSYFDLDVADRRVRDHLVDAIAMAPDLPLAEVLQQLPLATLKSVCDKHGVQVQGRGKAAYVAGIAAQVAPKSQSGGRAASRIKAVATPKRAAVKPPGPKAVASKSAAPKARASKAAAAKPAGKKVSGPSKPARAGKTGKAAKKPSRGAGRAHTKADAKPAAKASARGAKTPAKAATSVAKKASARAAVKPAAPKAATPRVKVARAAKVAPSAAKKRPKHAAAKEVAAPPAPENIAPAAAAPVASTKLPPNVIALPYVNTPAAVAAAEAAAAHLRSTADPALWSPPTTRQQNCASCNANLELRKCTVQKCSNMLVANPTRKICAECMFERNTLSMDDFNARMEEEANCPHCGRGWQNLS